MNEKTTTLEYKEPIIDEANEDESDAPNIGEMIEEMLGDLLQVELDTSEVANSKIDKKEFEKGIKDMSRIAGRFSVLRNVGMSEEAIITYMLNDRNIEHSQAMQKVINEGQLEITKIGAKNVGLNEELHQV